jgi:hypothetical protein
MHSRLVRHAALLLGAGTLLLTPMRTAGQSPAGPREKQIFVTVLDKSGAVVKDLQPSDFSVREDNAVREVTAAEAATDPLALAILVDTTRPPQGTDAGTQDLRKALASFVSTVQSAHEDTVISLTEFAGASVTMVNFTTKTADLSAAISKIYGGQQSGGVLFEALVDASRRVGRMSTPRRAIVSVDFDNTAESSQVLPSKVIEEVHAAGASLWALSIQRTGEAFAPPPLRESLLDALPNLTGGEHWHAIGTSSLESNLLKLADILTHQYLITYIRPDAKPVSVITPSSPRGAKTLMSPWLR